MNEMDLTRVKTNPTLIEQIILELKGSTKQKTQDMRLLVKISSEKLTSIGKTLMKLSLVILTE